MSVQSNKADGFNTQVTEASSQEAFKRELIHFHRCITEDREPLTNGEDARGDLELAAQMVQCAVVV